MNQTTRNPSNYVAQILDLGRIEAICLEWLTQQDETVVSVSLGLGEHAIVRANSGETFYLCSEGVGDMEPLSDDVGILLEIYGSYVDAAGAQTMDMFPKGTYTLSLTEAIECTTRNGLSHLKPLDSFIRTFGARLDSNYAIWEAHLARVDSKATELVAK